MSLFDTLIYQPLFNILVFLYQYIPGHDLGVAVIVLALLIRIALHTLTVDSVRTQRVTTKIQPQIKEIQEKYKEDKEKQATLIMQIWKENKINLFSGFLLIFIQIIIIFPLYRIFREGFNPDTLKILYSFVTNPGTVSPMFLGFIDLTKAYPSFAVIAGILQYFQTKMLMVKSPAPAAGSDKAAQFAASMQTQSLYVFPVFTILIFWGFPAIISLYWVATSAFSIVQQYIILKKLENTATN